MNSSDRRKPIVAFAVQAAAASALVLLFYGEVWAAAGIGKHAPAEIKPGPGEGWGAFMNVNHVGEIVISLALAAILGAVVVYHPRTYWKASTLEEFDQPKTFIM